MSETTTPAPITQLSPDCIRPEQSDIRPQTAPVRKRPQSLEPYPIDRKGLRERLLEAAGFGEAEQVSLIRQAVAKYQEKLKAKRSQVVSYMGQVTEVVEMEDNAAQLRAADAIIELTGVKPTPDVSSGKIKVAVELVLPDWARPTVIDIEPSNIGLECIESNTPSESTP